MAGFRTYRLGMIAVSALIMTAPATLADERTAEAAAERLRTLLAAQNVTMSWEGIEASGPDAVLAGVTLTVEDNAVDAGDLMLSGIAETDMGYRIERLHLDEHLAGDEDDSVAISGLELTGLILPDDEHLADYGGFPFYDTIRIDHVAIAADGEDVFSLEGLSAEMTRPANGSPIGMTGVIDSFTIGSAFLDEDQQFVLDALDYERIGGRVEMAGSWNPADGRLVMTRYDMTVNDAGTLGITLDLGGYTPDFIAALAELQAQLAENPQAADPAVNLGLLGLAQQLTLHQARIEFHDDTLTQRVLELIADRQGKSPADIAGEAERSVRFFLGMLGNAEFTDKAASAVAAFLADPRNIALVANPPASVPLALVAAGALSAPQMLPAQLGLSVVANE